MINKKVVVSTLLVIATLSSVTFFSTQHKVETKPPMTISGSFTYVNSHGNEFPVVFVVE